MVHGGTCAVPGAWGGGKHTIIYNLAKWTNTDCVVHVGCGERSAELAEVLQGFPEVRNLVLECKYLDHCGK